METLSTYEQQAIDFMNATGTTIECVYSKTGKYFPDDKEERDIYNVTMSRGNRKYSFSFGQSIVNSGFYYTKGKRIVPIDRKRINEKNLSFSIKCKDRDFLNNGKSDVIHYPKEPTFYDILACLQKYETGSFEDFCSEFGYDTDSKKAEKTYNAVKDEYQNLCALFTDAELEQLQEIQ